jgi:hypothetical protein
VLRIGPEGGKTAAVKLTLALGTLVEEMEARSLEAHVESAEKFDCCRREDFTLGVAGGGVQFRYLYGGSFGAKEE